MPGVLHGASGRAGARPRWCIRVCGDYPRCLLLDTCSGVHPLGSMALRTGSSVRICSFLGDNTKRTLDLLLLGKSLLVEGTELDRQTQLFFFTHILIPDAPLSQCSGGASSSKPELSNCSTPLAAPSARCNHDIHPRGKRVRFTAKTMFPRGSSHLTLPTLVSSN